MIEFPLKYELQAKATPGVDQKWEAYKNGTQSIEVSIPPDFKGSGEGYSPEDLFGLAILNCVIGMFKILAEKEKASFEAIEGKIVITLDKDETQNFFSVTEANLEFKIKNSEDFEKAKQVLEKAILSCPIGRSVKCAKTYNILPG
ncbi:MAG TPA: OsmC family protein [Chlamydiales bacterium]|nr:OsmC family protein [Chlamydiales bacterium]